MNHLLSTFYLMGCCQGFILVVILFLRHKNISRDRFLMVALTVWSLYLLEHYLHYFLIDFPHFLGATALFPLIIWPLLRSYLNCFSGKEGRVLWWEMVPAAVGYLILFPFYTGTANYKVYFLINHLPLPGEEMISAMILLQTPLYLIFMLKRLGRYHGLIQERYSNLTEIDLKWFRYFLILIALIWGGDALFKLVEHDSFLSAVLGVFQILILYMGSYFALLQREVKVVEVTVEQTDQRADQTPEKYQKSGLEGEEVGELFEQLKGLLDQKELFLNSDLTLSKLGEEMGLSGNHLSQVINQSTGESFYLLINRYRVAHFKGLLKQYPDEQLLTLGYRSGFGSKSAFNNAFKKVTGITPSTYRKNLVL